MKAKSKRSQDSKNLLLKEREETKLKMRKSKINNKIQSSRAKKIKKERNYSFELKVIKEEKIEPEFIVFCSKLCFTSNGTLCGCFGKGKVLIFNQFTYQKELTVKVDTCYINYLSILEDGSLVTSGYNGRIGIWESHTYRHIETLVGHEKRVNRTIQMSYHRIGSCSMDGTIRIWQGVKPYGLIILIICEGDVSSMIELSSKKYFVAAHSNRYLTFYDSKYYFQKIEFENIFCVGCEALTEIEGKLFVGALAGIAIFNSETLQFETFCKLWPKKEVTITAIVNIEKETFLCGDWVGGLYQFDLKTFEKLSYYKAHRHKINNLFLLKDNRLVSSCWETKIWKLKKN